MEDKNRLTGKKIKTYKIFILYLNIMFFIGLILISWYSIPVSFGDGINFLDILGITFLVIIFLIGYIHFFFTQFYLYNLTQKKMKYSLKFLDFAIKKKPYGEIKFSNIEKVWKIATDRGVSVLLKIYTKDGKIHYIGNEDLQGVFLYELKKRNLTNLIDEERKEISMIDEYLLRLKGGKIVQR
ncbi:MAG: hypothetical protein R6U61_08710 [Thermoplasmata archaeon]